MARNLTRIAALSALLTACITNVSLAQFHPDPVMNAALRQAAGIQSMGDMAVDAAAQAAKLQGMTRDMGSRIATARERYWATYPSNPGFGAAKAEFESLLRSKDYYYLNLKISMTSGIASLLGAEVDGGIPIGAYSAFEAWFTQVGHNIIEGHDSLLEAFADVESVRARILKAEPKYRSYVRIRDFEEFRNKGLAPPGVNAEAWRLAVLGNQFLNKGTVTDAYTTAFDVVAQGNTFANQCRSGLSSTLGIPVSPANCDCIHSVFKRDMSPWNLWLLETEFTGDKFIHASVSEFKIPDQVATCLRN